MNRTPRTHFLGLVAIAVSFLTGFYFEKARACKAALVLEEANNSLTLKRIDRQLLIWRELTQSSQEDLLQPEVGREELERLRAKLLDAKR